MITVRCFDGPYSGEVRQIFLGQVDPMSFFMSFTKHKWRWETNYSQATKEELSLFFQAEFIVRIMRALENGLSVKFLGESYQVGENDNLMDIAQWIEDAIANSGRMITIDSDDDNGVVIGTRGYENK